MENINSLLFEKEIITSVIDMVNYGSIEIRNKEGKQYVYVHYRDDGILHTKYAGEYTKQLCETIINNTKIVKIYKKRINEINKKLNLMQFASLKLSDTVKLNIDLAHRNLVDLIYKQAKLEGVATNWLDTEKLIKNGIVKNMSIVDAKKIINLKHAWEFVLSEGAMGCPTNYPLLCQINGLVEEGFTYSAGKLRTIPVKVGGCNYIPPFPFENIVKEELNQLIGSKLNVINKAIEIILFVMKKQLFLDGNKRTAIIFANHYLISHGQGLIVIPEDSIDVFKKLLVEYYENNGNEIKQFLFEKCWTKLK